MQCEKLNYDQDEGTLKQRAIFFAANNYVQSMGALSSKYVCNDLINNINNCHHNPPHINKKVTQEDLYMYIYLYC